MQFVLRFMIGGLVISLFALMGDVLKPKSFAGLFGAAPSVAMATLGLTIFANGKAYARLEAHSMILGASAFYVYARCCMYVMSKGEISAISATIAGLAVWMAFALGAWFAFLR
jgi:hypothetical protein